MTHRGRKSLFFFSWPITAIVFSAPAQLSDSNAFQISSFAVRSTPASGHFRNLVGHASVVDGTVEFREADREFSLLLPNQTPLTMDSSTPFWETLRKDGVVRVDGAISHASGEALRKKIDVMLAESIVDVATFKVPRAFRFANVLEKACRWDLLLPFDDKIEEDGNGGSSDPIMTALDELLGEEGSIAPIIEETLGPDAILYELACLISDPESLRQEIHPDIVYSADSLPIVACFVSLQDVDDTMGPTVFLPGTATEFHHAAINGDPEATDAMLSSTPSVSNTLGLGDASLYNPMLLHAGGGNFSHRRRRLFYCTFLDPTKIDPSSDFNPGSIRPDLKMRDLSFGEIKGALGEWRKQCSAAAT